jgi:hypothetical protein
MLNRNFFELVKAIKEAHLKPETFNLFTVLRSDSDEVRLHSRFLRALLDTQGEHTCGDEFLRAFLIELGVTEFDCNDIEVFNEYQNIDVYVKNRAKQVIILENKIYAGDQPKQLSRYYNVAKEEGCKDQNIWILYLTLDGDEPEKQSFEEIPETFRSSPNYKCISYKYFIKPWLNKCLRIAALSPAIRESIAQYTELISKLTGTNQSMEYMDKLKKLLLKDNNMTYVDDINEAYLENLIDLQLLLWNDINDYVINEYPAIGMPNEDSVILFKGDVQRSTISKYYKINQNHYFGLYYPLVNTSACVGIELDDYMTVGVCCNKTEAPEDYQLLLNSSYGKEKPNDEWPMWGFTQDDVEFKSLEPKTMDILIDKSKRKELAKKNS